MLSLDEVLHNRRKIMIDMAEQGFSDADIARYFELSPSRVNNILAKNIDASHKEILECNRTNNPELIVALMKERDQKIYEQLSDGDNDFSVLGFYFAPRNNLFGLAEKTYEKETSAPEQKIIPERKRNRYQAMHIVGELFADGFTLQEILDYLPDLNLNRIQMFIDRGITGYGIKKSASTEKVEQLIEDGYMCRHISELLNISEGTVTKIRKNMKTKEDPKKVDAYKNKKRREVIYRLHIIEKKTYAEIAEILNITRGTIISDIKQYFDEHPELGKIEKNTKNRSVRYDRSLSAKIEGKEQDIIQLRVDGMSIDKIIKSTKLKESAILKFIKEQEATPGTRLYEKKEELRIQIEKLVAEGKEIKEIARELGIPWRRVVNLNEKLQEKAEERAKEKAKEKAKE